MSSPCGGGGGGGRGALAEAVEASTERCGEEMGGAPRRAWSLARAAPWHAALEADEALALWRAAGASQGGLRSVRRVDLSFQDRVAGVFPPEV